MAIAMLLLVLLVGLLLLPFGLPGLWVMAGAILIYSFVAPAQIGVVIVVTAAVLAALGELIEFVLAGRYARKYGGSRRASWGAVIGGLVGALVGVPLPIVGSVVGALAGSFLGAMAAEFTLGSGAARATRVATGALIGRIVAMAAKIGIGIVVIVVVVFAILR
ncbi:MAG TPA: DUF456 domain-containing protein [Gemmatimonadaceae bacterium]|nr:DUF456 domain-containing protein [Gemmatimonadaceae bacterium]